MLELEEAVKRIVAVISPSGHESVGLAAAHGRICARAMMAPVDLPPFDNSSMDGYALRAADTQGANSQEPILLRLAGRVPAGSQSAGVSGPGECVRLFTGSPLPAGADAVIMQEETQTDAAEPAKVAVLAEVAPGENIRRRGEDVAAGRVIVEAGMGLTVGRVALLAALGIDTVAVGRRPVVGVLATGSELREAGQELAAGQIYESNRLAVTDLVRAAGGEARVLPVVRDALPETRAALMDAFGKCDILITTGGVSVGEMDFVKDAFEEGGGKLKFWRVAIKPGKPFVFGKRDEKLLFGLPGNPVSAIVTFLLLVRPAILAWQGAREVTLPSSPGILAEQLVNDGGRRHFVRVRVDTAGRVYSAGLQASHVLASLAAANGLVDVPPATKLQAGTSVRVFRWE